jgi:hypothetical protein
MTRLAFRSLFPAAALMAAVAVFAAACGGAAQTTTSTAASTTSAPAATSAASSATSATQSGSIVVSGLVDYPMTLTAVDTDYMDWVTETVNDPSAGSATFDGVKLTDIWSFFGVQGTAKTVTITGSDGSTAELALADISADALLVINEDNSFNMVMPGMAASAWVKDVVAMRFA